MKTPRITEAARAKAVADVRELLNELPGLNRDRERRHAAAQFEGVGVAILCRVAAILESGSPDAHWTDGPEWLKEIRHRWNEAMDPRVDA